MRVATDHHILTADPGASFDVVVDVVNTGDLIDGVTARLVGLDAAVVRVGPTVLPLFPGAGGQITLTVQLPASQPAGLHPVTVEVVSHVSGTTTQYLDLELSVAAQPGLRLSRQPALVRARRGARFVLAVENTGNVALDVTLGATSPDRCATRFNPPSMRIEPGTVTPAMLAVKGPRMITGTEVDRVVAVDLVGRRAHSIPAMDEAEAEPELTDRTSVTLKQRPLISRGLLTALILVGIVGLWAAVFLLGLTQVFAGDPLTKTAPASYFPVSVATGTHAGTAGKDAGKDAGAAPAGATPKTGLVSPSVGGTISGVVTAKSNAAPVGRILVQAYRMGRTGPVLVSSAATQSDGSYTLAGLFPTTYWLKFSAAGFATTWAPSAPAGAKTTGTKTVMETSLGGHGDRTELVAAGGGIQVAAQGKITGITTVVKGAHAQISGDVDPGDSLAPVTTTVTARMLDGGKATGKPITDTTDANGGYRLAGLKAPGTYQLSFTTPGYQVTTQTETVTGGEKRLEPTVLLSAHTGQLTGTVSTGTGTAKRGLGGVTVSTTVNGHEVSVITPTVGAVGAYSFDGLQTPGTYVVTFAAPGHGTATRIVDLGAGENGVANVTLTAGTGSVSGILLGPNGKGIGGATVTVGGTDSTVGSTAPATTTLTTGTVGAFTLSGLTAPGAYTLTFALTGYRPETVPISLSGDRAPAAVTAQLRTQLVKLWGTVTTPSGSKYAGATVVVTDGVHSRQTSSSSPSAALPSGGYLFPALDPGTYSVTVTAPGYGQQTAQVTLTSGTVRRNLVLQAGG